MTPPPPLPSGTRLLTRWTPNPGNTPARSAPGGIVLHPAFIDEKACSPAVWPRSRVAN